MPRLTPLKSSNSRFVILSGSTRSHRTGEAPAKNPHFASNRELLKSADVVRKLRQLGYIGPLPGGRHMRMIHPHSGKIIPIPVHGSRDVSVGLIWAIIAEVGIPRDEWINL